MPLGKSLSKVEKKASAGGKLNPRSRKMAQLARAQLRQDRLTGKASARHRAGEHRLARLAFFQTILDGRIEALSVEEMQELIAQFLARNKEELASLVKSRQINRPKSVRQELLEMLDEAERKEFQTGFILPDCSDRDTLVSLKNWDGSAQTMHAISLIELSESGRLRKLGGKTVV